MSRVASTVLVSLVLVAVLAPQGAPRSVAAQEPEALLAVHSADPLELARVVDRIGDDAVLQRLGAETPLPVRLAAVRASAWLHAPELALPALAELASGRDPDLAPAAARAVLRIAEALDRAALDAREHDGDEIERALPILSALAADGTARADLRRAAAVAVGYLDALVHASAPAEAEPSTSPPETGE